MFQKSTMILVILMLGSLMAKSENSILVEADLINIARAIKSQKCKSEGAIRIKEIMQNISRADAQYKRFAFLLDGFICLDAEQNITKAETIRSKLAKESNITKWEMYCVRILQASIEVRKGKLHDAQLSIDWLCENLSDMENGKKESKLCEALIKGLEKDKGPFEAGLKLAQAEIMFKNGQRKEAKNIYHLIIEKYPNTGWAISARNRLNHLKNMKYFAKIMKKNITVKE